MLDSLACLLVNAIGWLLCRLPPEAAVWLGERLGVIACWLQPKRVRIGMGNLRAAFDGTLTPAQASRIIRRCYQHLGAGFIELLRLPVIDRAYIDRYVSVEHYHWFESKVTAREPLILLTGHYGNWELSSITAALLGHPIVALARIQGGFPKLYTLLVSYRESKGCTIAHKGGGMKRLLAALARGQPIGIVADQASRQGIFLDFFGRPALFATGPVELALKQQATVLPAFTQRVRGPYHRIVLGPPITLSRALPKEEAVRKGLEAFAQALAQRIREDPSQWLWMHKRWKHTPARRVLVLNDGKTGHLRQSLAVVAALHEHRQPVSHTVIDIQYRNAAARALALVWSWWMPGGFGAAWCLSRALTRESAGTLLARYADVIVSCGAATAPVNLLWSAANRAKSLVVMNPAPLPLRRFSLVIAPRHDALPRRANVVQTDGAIVGRMSEETLAQAKGRLRTHPRFRGDGAVRVDGATRGDDAAGEGKPLPHPHPVIALFIGGDTLHYALGQAFAEALVEQVRTACEAIDGWCLVTTSRRTSASVERLLSERLGRDPRCRLLLIANRDPIDLPALPGGGAQAGGTMEGMLGCADVAVVTGESISMVSEACTSGRRVIVVEPPLRSAGQTTLTRHQRFLHGLVQEGVARMVPVPELAHAIQRALKERQPPRRLDAFAAVREAVGKLF